MRRKCKFRESGEYKDGFLLGFSVDSKGSATGVMYQYPVALIETREFGDNILKVVPIEYNNVIFEED